MSALVDDHIILLSTMQDNIAKAREAWDLFVVAFCLKINMRKSILNLCTKTNLEDLGYVALIVPVVMFVYTWIIPLVWGVK